MYRLGEYVNVFVSVPGVVLGPLFLEPAQVIGLAGALFFIAVNYIGAKETGRLQNVSSSRWSSSCRRSPSSGC